MPRFIVVIASCIALAIGVAACGDSSSSSSSETSSPASSESTEGESSGGPTAFVAPERQEAFEFLTGEKPFETEPTVAELKPRVEQYETAPTELLNSKPLSKKAPSDITVAVIHPGVPVAFEYVDQEKIAAEKLGWEVIPINGGLTPQEYLAGYKRAVELNPDLVIGYGPPREVIDVGLKEVEAAGIPIIQWGVPMEPVKDKLWTTVDEPNYWAGGMEVAELIAYESELKGEVLFLTSPEFPILHEGFLGSLKEYLGGICPECETHEVEANLEEIGKLGTQATAELQKHPDIEYLVCSAADLCTGVSAALKSAGNNDVKIITRDPTTTDYQQIANGGEYAASALPVAETSFQVIDLAQRVLNKESGIQEPGTAETPNSFRMFPQMIVTKDYLEQFDDPGSPEVGGVPDYEEQYEKLWLLK